MLADVHVPFPTTFASIFASMPNDRQRRSFAAVLASATACVSFLANVAAGEASGFAKARAPFAPQLVVDNDHAVCTLFVEAVRREFFETNYKRSAPFDIDVTDRDWPGAQVRWLFPGTASEVGFGERDAMLNIHHSAVLADLDRDGSPEALALYGWVHSWRGSNYALVRYPDFATYFRTLENAKAQVAAVDAIERGDGRNSLSWDWARPSVVELGGAFYLVDAGEVYHHSPTISLRRIPARGPAIETCRVLKWRPIDSLGGNAQAVREFMTTLRAIAGTTDGACGGTLNPTTRLAILQPTIEALAVTRPWAFPEPYNTRADVDRELVYWSELGLWNKRLVRKLKTQQAAAIDALARDYRDSFGLTEADARREALKSVDLVLRHRFIFLSGGHWPELPSDRRTLQKMILDGAALAKIEWFLRKGEHLFTPTLPSLCEPPFEPLLFAALERPAVMRALLRRGATIDDRNAIGKTALMAAAHFDLAPAARLLLSRGADVNARTSPNERSYMTFRERTALMYAAENAHLPMIRLLVEAGADVAAVDSAKRDVFNYLRRNTAMTTREREQATAYLKAALVKAKP